MVDGVRYRLEVMAFVLLDYGYIEPIRNRTPGIPMHQASLRARTHVPVR